MEDILKKLIEFPTISESSNEDIMRYIDKYLGKFDVKGKLIRGEKNQFNYHCMIGPNKDGGIIFSGHTDVVPVEGQNWLSEPFKLLKKKDKFYGRGTCDMKGFIAVCLSLVPEIKKKKLKKPIHFIFSYDEEIGCVGIRKLIPFLKKLKPKPDFCLVGEPTEMKVINQHKGKKNFLVSFQGHEAHSSLTEDGVNSIDYCSKFINYLSEIQSELINKYKNNKYSPAYPTLNVGKINGGLAVNIIPNKCVMEFEIRDTPEMESKLFINKIKRFLKELEADMKKKVKNCKIELEVKNNFPPLLTNYSSNFISLCLQALKKNSTSAVSFGTEAGIFNEIGFETIVCGPGSIKQAHKPNEFIEIKQLDKCRDFLLKLIELQY
jgi:acetylornithine deacetylase